MIVVNSSVFNLLLQHHYKIKDLPLLGKPFGGFMKECAKNVYAITFIL